MKPKYIKFDIEALSLNELKAKYPQHVWSSWFGSEKFANEEAVAGHYELYFDYPNSRNKTWDDQQKLLKKGESVPSAAVVAQALIQHFEKTGKRLLPDSWSRTNDIDSDGGRVNVGYFDSVGLVVYGRWGGLRDSDLGLAASRNFVPLKLEPGKLDVPLENSNSKFEDGDVITLNGIKYRKVEDEQS